MRLWYSRLLEHELAEGRLSEWEKTKYFLFPLMLSAFLSGPIWMITPNYGPIPPVTERFFTLLGGLITAAITYIGIKMGYRSNQRIDGKNFIERYAILSVPIFIRFIVIATTLMIIILIFLRHSMRDSVSPFLHVIIPLAYLYYFHLVALSIDRFGDCIHRYKHSNHGLESTGAPPSAKAPETHP